MALYHSNLISDEEWREWRSQVKELPGTYLSSEQKYNRTTKNFKAVIRRPGGFDQDEVAEIKDSGCEILSIDTEYWCNKMLAELTIAKPKDAVLNE